MKSIITIGVIALVVIAAIMANDASREADARADRARHATEYLKCMNSTNTDACIPPEAK
jgi:hypothetical protein